MLDSGSSPRIPIHLAVDHSTRIGITAEIDADSAITMDEHNPRLIVWLNPASPPASLLWFCISTDANVASLLQKLDRFVTEHADSKAASFVNLLGEDAGILKGQAEKLVKDSGSKKIAIVVPKEHQNGPANYKLNPDVEVTVLLFKDGQVEANHALSAKELDREAIATIVNDAGKMFQ